jgi:hypothetical protein
VRNMEVRAWIVVDDVSLKDTCLRLRILCKVASGIYEGVSRTFRTGRLERELQMVQISATSCSCSAIL